MLLLWAGWDLSWAAGIASLEATLGGSAFHDRWVFRSSIASYRRKLPNEGRVL